MFRTTIKVGHVYEICCKANYIYAIVHNAEGRDYQGAFGLNHRQMSIDKSLRWNWEEGRNRRKATSEKIFLQRNGESREYAEMRRTLTSRK